ncbi:MAG TPA: hypothetical protein VJX67_12605 [Blastocatellia bacterium]|nr:hypothetical protein [Blastocatellia bacterium]
MISELDKTGLVLHERLLAGDELATAEIAELFLPPLFRSLASNYRSVRDSDLITTAVEDSLLSYFANASKFDPSRLGLFAYLRMSAEGDLLNSLRKPKIVELTALDSEHVLEGLHGTSDPEGLMIKCDSPLLREVNELIKNQVDREFFALMAEGVRETSDYAALLGISDLPVTEQAAVVKRHKDRLKKSLQRKMKRRAGSHE